MMDFSLLASIFESLRLPPPARLTLLDAQTLASAHFPPTPPDVDTLISGVDSRELAAQLKEIYLSAYPADYEIKVVAHRETYSIALSALDSLSEFPSSLYIPALAEGTSFEAFAEVVAHLRAPDGCPWDKEQTHQSLRTHLLEESYEILSAMDADDVEAMREEFGDLLLQIVLNAQIAREGNEFLITDVVKHIHDKIVRRHPHVFGDVKLDGVQGVLQNWEKLKAEERGKKNENKGLLDGVPSALPALTQAQEYQARAARVGFDWPEVEGVLDKIREEIEEVKQAENLEQVAEELGDLFFVLVNLARWRKVDAESALRGTNIKFKKRFGYVEQGAKRQGRSLSDMTLEEMDALWDEAKGGGKDEFRRMKDEG